MRKDDRWEVIHYSDGKPAGTVLVAPNVNGMFCAYRALPVCPGLNWSETYPDKVAKLSKTRDDLIEWLLDNK